MFFEWLMKKMSSKLVTLDILAPEVKFNIDGSTAIRTKTGACLTLCYFALLACLSIYIIRNFTRTDIPTSMIEVFHSADYPKIDLIEQRFVPMVVAFNGLTDFIPNDELPKYVSIVLSQQTWVTVTDSEGNADSRLENVYFDVVRCNLLTKEKRQVYDFFDPNSYLSKIMDKYGFCVAHDESNFYVNGKGSDDVFKLISLTFKPCSLSSGCKTKEEVGKVNFMITTPQTSLDLSNLDQPFLRSPNADTFYYIHPGMNQQYFSKIKLNKVQDYRGVVPTWKKRLQFFDIKETFYNIGYRDQTKIFCNPQNLLDYNECPPYMEFSFQSSVTTTRINRRYKTLTETFGEIGGIKEVLLMAFMILYSRYHSKRRAEFMIKKVFSFFQDIDNNEASQLAATKASKDFDLSDQRTSICCKKKTKKQLLMEQLKTHALKNIENNLNILNMIKEFNLLKILCYFFFKSHHFKLTPILQFNLFRRHQAEKQDLSSRENEGQTATAAIHHSQKLFSAEDFDGSSKGTTEGLLADNQAKIQSYENAYSRIAPKAHREAGTDSLEHQLDLFFYKCMKETDEYIHKKNAQALNKYPRNRSHRGNEAADLDHSAQQLNERSEPDILNLVMPVRKLLNPKHLMQPNLSLGTQQAPKATDQQPPAKSSTLDLLQRSSQYT